MSFYAEMIKMKNILQGNRINTPIFLTGVFEDVQSNIPVVYGEKAYKTKVETNLQLYNMQNTVPTGEEGYYQQLPKKGAVEID
jgi:hypothetical protein